MNKGLRTDRQLYLFEKRLAWHEFPEEIRERVVQLFATMCVEIIGEFHPPSESKEQSDEPTED